MKVGKNVLSLMMWVFLSYIQMLLAIQLSVFSDDDALSRSMKEVNNDKISFVWTQFAGLISYLRTRAQDPKKLKSCIAEAIALKTRESKTAWKRAKIICQINDS